MLLLLLLLFVAVCHLLLFTLPFGVTGSLCSVIMALSGHLLNFFFFFFALGR